MKNSNKKLFVLYGSDNMYKSTITAVANFMLSDDYSPNLDIININTLNSNIEGIKTDILAYQFKNFFTFAKIPKKIYSAIADNKYMLSDSNNARLGKEMERARFVEWVEYQKMIFGTNVWAKKVVNQINRRVKQFDSFWIGDLRFGVELNEIQKNIHKRIRTEFIHIELDGSNITQAVYYENQDDTININNFQHKIIIDSNQSYNFIVEDIYYQLKQILQCN